MSTEVGLRHDAFVYDSDHDYVARSVAFLKGGLAAGERCIVANTRPRLADMRDALGSHADQVAFVDVSHVYTRPAKAVATYYGAFLAHLRLAPAVRAVADLQFGPALDGWEEWEGYEAVTNLAYRHLPVWVICTYNANALPDAVVNAAWRTHPQVTGGDGEAHDRFEDPRALLRRVTPDAEALPELRSFPGTADLERFRERLARELAREQLPEAKALDMLVAATEVAANAIGHGGGIEEVRAGRAEGRFVCEVIDRGGGFDDPAAGYLVPREGTGRGLWIARQLTWRLEFFQSPRGFTVRVWL